MSRKEGFYWVKIKRGGVENWEPKNLTSPNIVNLLPNEQLLEINENRIPSPEEIDEDSFLIKMAKKFTSNSDIDFSQGDEKAIEQLKKKYGI